MAESIPTTPGSLVEFDGQRWVLRETTINGWPNKMWTSLTTDEWWPAGTVALAQTRVRVLFDAATLEES